MKMPPWLQSLIIGCGLAVGSVYASLYVADWVCLKSDVKKSLPANGLVGGQKYTWGHVVRINSFSSRGAEPTVPKPDGVFRIVALGDSLTWGAGVAEEERYTGAIEKILQQEESTSHVEIFNLANSGAPMLDYRDRLNRWGDKLEPDLLIVGFCVNDPQPKGQNYSPERSAYIKRNLDVIMYLARLRKYFPNLAARGKKGLLAWGEISGAYPKWPEALDRTYNKESKEWGEFVTALEEIKQWSDDRNLPTPILMGLTQGSSTVHPTYFSNPSPDPMLTYFNKWHAQVLEEAKRIGFVTLYPYDLFQERLEGQVLGVNELDGHPSAAEHAIYAEVFAQQIKTLFPEQLQVTKEVEAQGLAAD